jgi:ADP-ribose pyrophosphatase
MTNANMRLCTVRVKLSESDPEPKQKLDEGEHIVKRIVEVKELYNVLQGRFPISYMFNAGEWEG